MERDPLRLAWKTSRLRHVFGFCLLALAGLCLLVGLELIRIVVDRAVAGGGSAPPALLRIVLTPPASVWPEPLVLFSGLTLSPETFTLASIGGILLIPVLIALLLIPVDGIAVSIGSRALAKLRAVALEAILKAPPSAQDDLSMATALAAHGLARKNSVLGLSLFVPVKLGGMIGLSFAYVLVMDWHLGATLAATLSVGAILNARRALLRFDATAARHKEGESAESILADLEHRIPAMRAHGTGFYERDRVHNLLIEGHRPVARREYRLALVDSTAAIVLMLAPVAVLALGAWFAGSRPLTAGMVAACVLASALAAYGVRELVQWHRTALRARALLTDVARSLSALKPRGIKKGKASLPENGALVAQGVSAYDPASGARITSVNLNLAFPSHVALVGDGDSGPRLLAALMSGQIHPSVGRMTYGGVDLVEANPFERSQRIAFAGETVLIEGSLKENLLYGCQGPAEELEHRLSEAIAITGLDRLTHARGLSGTLDPKKEPAIAAAIVEARRFVQAALAREQLDRFVDPFDAARYNRYATIGENLLFGKPVGDTFQEDRLSAHPYVRAILEANDLTKILSQVGLSIASSMIEIFADIPDGHPLFERFSFFSAADRAYFQDLVERQSGQRRPGRDQERLIGLALRYNESRHRLGLLDEALEARILTARADFAPMLPVSLKPSIEFYDQALFCSAASVQDNLLFGRIAADQAGAAEAVQGVIRHVLTERGLDGEVSRIGLDLPIDPQGDDLSLTETAAVDLVRCLVRRPSVLVVQRALDGRPGPAADRLVAALRRSMVGRGLVIVTPSVSPIMDHPPFDAVIRFERGEPVMVPRIRQPEALSA
ncbi:multidrug ABC transporter ATP-binding protein [Microvirga sp. KLBC 81]|uniref:ABC transporter ATP-binding protein/permease n=1 Tax=Microvirga sp. KLBC 81 TaxID=1862707 RepID=UPI000D51EA92|nr:ABC transporter ATP-binding protein/permease [Microvirga sp. KLBC 81]PVE20428.1 multidrug ABC transporter ATP-binding protein [Microvirga sp. KLBC 81]